MVLARAAHAWSNWRSEAERTGDFSRSPEIDMLEDAAERALIAITHLSTVEVDNPSVGPGGLSIDADDLVALCASCKHVRTEENSWITLEAYLQNAHQKWVTHALCETCAADARDALYATAR